MSDILSQRVAKCREDAPRPNYHRKQHAIVAILASLLYKSTLIWLNMDEADACYDVIYVGVGDR